MLAVSVSANAQQKMQERKMPSKEEMAQRMTDRMVEKYGLNDEQKAKLLELNKEYGDKMQRPRRITPRRNLNKGDDNGNPTQPARPSEEEMKKLREQTRQNHEAYNSKLKEILTDEQYKKYTDDQQKQRQQRRARGVKRMPRPSIQ